MTEIFETNPLREEILRPIFEEGRRVEKNLRRAWGNLVEELLEEREISE